jgi:hypothetical protein
VRIRTALPASESFEAPWLLARRVEHHTFDPDEPTQRELREVFTVWESVKKWVQVRADVCEHIDVAQENASPSKCERDCS